MANLKQWMSVWVMTMLVAASVMTGCATERSTTVSSSTRSERSERQVVNKPTVTAPTNPTPAPKSTPAVTSTRTNKQSFSATTRTSGNTTYVSMAYPTGDPSTSAIGIEKAVPREARVNAPFTYSLKATNLTNHALRDVVVSEKVASNLKITASSPRGQASTDGTVTWPLGTLGPNESRTVNVTAVISEPGMGSSCASVSYSSSLCTSVQAVEPKLLVALAGPAQVLACEDIEYTVRVTNTGTGSVKGVQVSQPLPDGLTTKDGKRSVDLSVMALGPDESKQFVVPVRAAKAGSYTYKATAKSTGGLTATSNPVTTVVRKPTLTITKKGPRKAFMGRTVGYEMVVTNTGDGEARNTVVEDILSAGAVVTKTSAGGQQSGNVVRWNLGTLEPKASRTLKLSLKADKAGIIRNTAKASAFCADAVSATADTSFEGIAAILLEVIDLEDPIEIGENVVYVITATNQGTANGTNIQIQCNLEENLEYVSSTGATKGDLKNSTVNFAPVAVLKPGEEVSWRLIAKAVKPGDVRFQVSLNSDQLGRPVNEDEATNLY